jgi:hypothetical protein
MAKSSGSPVSRSEDGEPSMTISSICAPNPSGPIGCPLTVLESRMSPKLLWAERSAL